MSFASCSPVLRFAAVAVVLTATAVAADRPKTLCDDYPRQRLDELIAPAVREANEAVTEVLRAGTDPLAPLRASAAWLASHGDNAGDGAEWRATLDRIDAARERQRPDSVNGSDYFTLPWYLRTPAWEFGSYWTRADDEPNWHSCRPTMTGGWFTRIRHARAFPTFADDWLPGWSIDGELELVFATDDGELTHTLEASPFPANATWSEAFEVKRAMGRDSWLRARVVAVAEVGGDRVSMALVRWRRTPGHYDRNATELIAVRNGALARVSVPFSSGQFNTFTPFEEFGTLGVLPTVSSVPGIGYSIERGLLAVRGACPKDIDSIRDGKDILCMRLAGRSRAEVQERIEKANRKRRWPVASTGEGSIEESIDELLHAVPQVLFVP